MALDDTIRQVWARALLRNLQKTQVFGQPGITNRNYEGEVREWGDRVHISAIGAVDVIAYTKNTDLSALQVLDDSKQTLTIDQQDAFNVFLDDIDRVQANPGLAAELSEEAAYALSDDADEFLAALMVAGATGALTPTLSTSGDAYEAMVDAGVTLDEANIPSQGRFAVIPPWFHGVILKDDRFVASGTPATDSRLRNGIVGEAAGFTLVKSNNVPSAAATTATLATSAATDDILDSTAHGFVEDQEIQFTALTGGAGLSTGTRYYVIAANLAANTFQVSETRGGTAADFTTDITAGTAASLPTATIVAGVPSATTFAEQISKVESIRNDKRFGDNVRGLHVYGGKVIRPTGLVTVTAARPL